MSSDWPQDYPYKDVQAVLSVLAGNQPPPWCELALHLYNVEGFVLGQMFPQGCPEPDALHLKSAGPPPDRAAFKAALQKCHDEHVKKSGTQKVVGGLADWKLLLRAIIEMVLGNL